MAYYKKSEQPSEGKEDKALAKFGDLMIEAITNIKDGWRKTWFTEGASMEWPVNMDKRPYNGMNALLLSFQCQKMGYEMPVFMTYRKCADLNLDKDGNQKVDKEGKALPITHVNKGEKSFPVFLTTFTVVNKDTHKKIKFEEYKLLSRQEQDNYNVYPSMKVYDVFNVQQTNLKEARPELYEKLLKQFGPKKEQAREGKDCSFPLLDDVIKNNSWICPIKEVYQDRALYNDIVNSIVVPIPSQFETMNDRVSTVFHEMAHSTGHKDYLDRFKNRDEMSFGSRAYGVEELRAELSAALVCMRMGINKTVKSESAAYLKSWLSTIKQNPEFIKTVLGDVKKIYNLMVEKIPQIEKNVELGESRQQQNEIKDGIEGMSLKDNIPEKIAQFCRVTGLDNEKYGKALAMGEEIYASNVELSHEYGENTKIWFMNIKADENGDVLVNDMKFDDYMKNLTFDSTKEHMRVSAVSFLKEGLLPLDASLSQTERDRACELSPLDALKEAFEKTTSNKWERTNDLFEHMSDFLKNNLAFNMVGSQQTYALGKNMATELDAYIDNPQTLKLEFKKADIKIKDEELSASQSKSNTISETNELSHSRIRR